MGNFCSCYIKTPDEEIIKDPRVLAQIRNKEYEEYVRNSKPKKHLKIYRLNHSFTNENKKYDEAKTTKS